MDQYTIYIEPLTGAVYRDGVRNSKYVIDKALTGSGFNGTIDVDWENVFEIE